MINQTMGGRSERGDKDAGKLHLPSFPGREFRAPITRISHDVDLKTRTMSVELDVSDPLGELVPRVFCQVEWPVRRTYATLFVPVSAVASDLRRSFVIRSTKIAPNGLTSRLAPEMATLSTVLRYRGCSGSLSIFSRTRMPSVFVVEIRYR